MHGSNQSEADALAIQAYELFMATHLEPDNLEARARLIDWAQESPAHWRAFLALDQYLEEVSQLLEGGQAWEKPARVKAQQASGLPAGQVAQIQR